VPRILTEPERERFLAEKHVGVLSVTAHDGRPPASVPIWYDYTPSGNIRINTDASRRKAKLIERAGVVTLVVQREEPPYQYVVVEGTVVETTSPTHWRHGKPSLSAISARTADASGCGALAITTAYCSPSAPTAGSLPTSPMTSDRRHI
jgi:nitroimidazol reductase NimA-like FMN-containing flavoprotein (pyridoxamine 5'-phosphate oxidase superfamily)